MKCGEEATLGSFLLSFMLHQFFYYFWFKVEKRSEYCVTVKLIILSLADMQFGSSVLLVSWLMCHVAHLT